MAAEVVYTRNQICNEVYALTGRFVSEDDSFYKWLDTAVTKLKPLYTKRDLKKFLFVGFYLYIKRSFNVAKQVLVLDLKENKYLFSEAISIAEFVSTHPMILIAQIKRNEKPKKNSRKQQHSPSTLRHVQVLSGVSA